MGVGVGVSLHPPGGCEGLRNLYPSGHREPLLSSAVTAVRPAGSRESRWAAASQGGNQGHYTCVPSPRLLCRHFIHLHKQEGEVSG